MVDGLGKLAMVTRLLMWTNQWWAAFELTKLPADSQLTSYVLGITMMA